MIAFLLSLVSSKVLLQQHEERQFLSWMRNNNQFYTGDEYHLRLGIFLSNLRFIQDFNRKNDRTFRVGINKFSCYTPAEYKSLLGGRPKKSTRPSIRKTIVSNAPESYDWRDKNVVNPIKDQASCGSCWAFSSIATSESAYAIRTGKLLQFSEQNLVDCAPCFGCNGGWSDLACSYVIKEQDGLFNSETDYPYTAVDQTCTFDKTKGIGKITDIIPVQSGDENDLLNKVATLGVASVSISAGNTPFMSYTGGILDDDACAGAGIDHAVACVGYGAENGVDYWIVRNSWGTSWGEQGYVRMSRNKSNQCSIASEAFVAIDNE